MSWIAILILAFSSGKTTDAVVSHGLAAGVGYVVGRKSTQTSQVMQANQVIYSTTGNACRCQDLRGGCGWPSGKGWDVPVSHRAFLMMACGATRSVVITKRTWTTDGYLYLEWTANGN